MKKEKEAGMICQGEQKLNDSSSGGLKKNYLYPSLFIYIWDPISSVYPGRLHRPSNGRQRTENRSNSEIEVKKEKQGSAKRCILLFSCSKGYPKF